MNHRGFFTTEALRHGVGKTMSGLSVSQFLCGENGFMNNQTMNGTVFILPRIGFRPRRNA